MSTPILYHSSEAAKLLIQGEVVALPTETVYGLAGNATQAEMVKKIFIAKERPSFDPLIVHISKKYLNENKILSELVQDGILDTSVLNWKNKDKIESVMKFFWPGPLTMILPKGRLIPGEVTSNQDTVGIRCPNHPLFQAVLSEVPFPLAAPSANRFGRISPTCSEHVIKELSGRIAGVLEGGSCEIGVESTIIKINEDQITLLRPGKISHSEIEKAFEQKVESAPSLMQTIAEQSISPGMLDEHYAPRKPLQLIPASFENPSTLDLLESNSNFTQKNSAFLSMSGICEEIRSKINGTVLVLSPEKNIEVMARKLFSKLRELDEKNEVSYLFSDIPLNIKEGLGASIFDRLKRASRNKPNSPQ